jgi:hypothetical protein
MTLGFIALGLAWKFIAPDAQQVVAMEWKRVLESPLSASIRREIPPSAIPALSGINFIEGIERAIWTPGLVVLEGSFDLERLKDMALGDGGVVKAYKKAEQLGLVGPTLVLLGPTNKLKAAIDRSEKATNTGPGDYDLWIRTTGAEFQRHDFGIQLSSDVRVTSKLRCTSDTSARAAVENGSTFGMSGTNSGMEASLSGRFSREEFTKRQWRTALESLPTTSQTPPRKPDVIRIYGLEGGVKEIPLK